MEKKEMKANWFPIKYRNLDTKEVNVAEKPEDLPAKFQVLITRYHPE